MNDLTLGVIAGVGALSLLLFAKEIDKKNNEIKYKESESRIREIKKVESSISNLQIVYKYIPINTVCKLESQAVIEINNNLRSK